MRTPALKGRNVFRAQATSSTDNESRAITEGKISHIVNCNSGRGLVIERARAEARAFKIEARAGSSLEPQLIRTQAMPAAENY